MHAVRPVIKKPSSTPTALMLEGVPQNTVAEDVYRFFQSFEFVLGTAKLKIDSKRQQLNLAAIIFKSDEEAERAKLAKDRTYMGNRWISISDIEMRHYETFNSFDRHQINIRCDSSLTKNNVLRCVKLQGLPYQSTKHTTLIEFFAGFDLSKKDIILDIERGKLTGYAMVELKTEAEAVRAIEELNKKEIGKRWIGVSAAQLLEDYPMK